MPKVASILVFDPVVEDRIYKVRQDTFDRLVTSFALSPNGKKALGLHTMKALLEELSSEKPLLAHGGSGGTMAFTLKRLFPELEIRFGGVVGGTDYSHTIESTFRQAGIQLLPYALPVGVSPHLAVSAMLVPEGGDRTIATYPGTFGQVITPAILTDDLVRDVDVIHLLATNHEGSRLGCEFVDRLLELRSNHGKALWFNFPTHQECAEENAEYFQRILPSVTLALGNLDEVKWTYGTADTQTALARLQQAFQQNALESSGKTNDDTQPAAFITNDKEPAYVITAESITAIPAKPVPPAEIVNNGGAGDTALAGFAGSYCIRGLSPAISASIGHALAARKLRQYEPCLENPWQALWSDEPELAKTLMNSGPAETTLTGVYKMSFAHV